MLKDFQKQINIFLSKSVSNYIAIIWILTLFAVFSGCKPDTDQRGAAIDNAIQIQDDFNELAFDPTNQIFPFPNDMAWLLEATPEERKGMVTFDAYYEQNPFLKALFNATNSLGIRGLSPNTVIQIPLTKSITLDTTSLLKRVKLLNLNINTFISSIRVVQDANRLKIYPINPLEPNCKYLVVLLDGITDINGNLLKTPEYFRALQSDEPLTGYLQYLERIRQQYSNIYKENLLQHNIQKNETILMFTFTTADRTFTLKDIETISQAAKNIQTCENVENMHIEGLNYNDIEKEYSKIHQYKSLLALKNKKFKTLENSEPRSIVSYDVSSLYNDSPVSIQVPYIISNGGHYQGSIFIFQHGFEEDKNQATTLEPDFPIIAIDLPKHGERISQDCQNATSCFLSEYGKNLRVNLYQSYFDLTMLLQYIKKGDLDLSGDGINDMPDNIYFIGNSFGAMTGSVFASFNNAYLKKIALCTGGANLSAIVDSSSNSIIQNFASNIKQNRTDMMYFKLMGLFQMLIDPADPQYLSNADTTSKILIQTAYHDTVISPVANEMLSTRLGYPFSKIKLLMDMDDVDPKQYVRAGWYQYGGYPEKTDNWINHGFTIYPDMINQSGELIFPETSGRADTSYNKQAHTTAVSQLQIFFK